MGLSRQEKAILRHEDVNAKFLEIGLKAEQIVDRINAFDWLDIQLANSEEQMALIIMRFYASFKIQCPKMFEPIVVKAFAVKFTEALKYLKGGIEEVHSSYNIPGTPRGFQNDTVNRFYYINYWADKKSIPVNYNEKKQDRRELFNLDTIILSILADKLNAFNEFERNKPKGK